MFSAEAFILFIKKKNDSLRLYIDYWELNDITDKDCEVLLLINELLNCLRKIKYFTTLNL